MWPRRGDRLCLPSATDGRPSGASKYNESHFVMLPGVSPLATDDRPSGASKWMHSRPDRFNVPVLRSPGVSWILVAALCAQSQNGSSADPQAAVLTKAREIRLLAPDRAMLGLPVQLE